MGKYIDTDVLECIAWNESDEGDGTFAEGVLFVLDKIASMPTVNTVPAAYGQWIDKPTGRYGRMQSWCSACGKHSGIGGIKSNRHKPYCPNCGVEMNGGIDNG